MNNNGLLEMRAEPAQTEAGSTTPGQAGHPDTANGVGLELTPNLPVRFDTRILRALRQISRCIDLYSKQLLATSHITAPQLVCLLTVEEFGPLTVSAIGRLVHLSPSTVVGILDRLEERGLIERTRANDDRRVVLVSATVRGIRLAQQAPSPLQQTLASRLAALPDLEQATIALSLERIVDLMEAQQQAETPATGTRTDGAPAP